MKKLNPLHRKIQNFTKRADYAVKAISSLHNRLFLSFSRCKMSIAIAGITTTLITLYSPHLSQTISRATSKINDRPFEITEILLGINPYPKRITGVRAQGVVA
jgi:hypothetical protein